MGFSWDYLLNGFSIALSWQNWALVGSLIGTLVGVLPGIGPSSGIAILLPLTTFLPPTSAIIMMAAFYYGAMYGGSTTAIVVNIPGEASSVPTALDGYEMAKQGNPGPALSMAAISNSVSILLGAGNGTFSVGSTVGVGVGPSGIAAADVDGDLDTDLVTVNATSATASVLTNAGGAVFSVTATHPVPATNPTAVALLDLSGDLAPELAVTSRGNRTLTVFANSSGSFGSPYDYPVRNSPRAITPLDVDADGRLDLAVPCWQADSVVVLLSRPPALLEAPRVTVGDQPQAIVAEACQPTSLRIFPTPPHPKRGLMTMPPTTCCVCAERNGIAPARPPG